MSHSGLVPGLLLGQFQLAVQSEAQNLLLVQGIIQPLLQLLHLITNILSASVTPHSRPDVRHYFYLGHIVGFHGV